MLMTELMMETERWKYVPGYVPAWMERDYNKRKERAMAMYRRVKENAFNKVYSVMYII